VAASRAVRIARSSRRSGASTAFIPNHAGERRAWRLFATYLLALAVIYALFLGLALTSPSPGPRDDTAAWASLTLLAAALAGGGWTITLGRAPRGAALVGGDLAVRERWGRVRRFPAGSEAHRRVVHHYPSGILGPDATEMVELVAVDRSRRTYLVGEGYFERLALGAT
jgi:hypothetical protein